MAIILDEEITIPSKSFNKMWVRRIEISPININSEINAVAVLVPYNVDGEFYEPGAVTLNIIDIVKKSENAESNIAKAMYYLIESINEEYMASIVPLPEPELEPEV